MEVWTVVLGTTLACLVFSALTALRPKKPKVHFPTGRSIIEAVKAKDARAVRAKVAGRKT